MAFVETMTPRQRVMNALAMKPEDRTPVANPTNVAPVALMALGIGWLLSALGVFFRDLAQLTQVFGMVLLYATIRKSA